MKSFPKKFALKNPVWQGIGAIVGILGILVSVFIAYDVYRKSIQFSDLTIEKRFSFNPLDFAGTTNGRIAISIGGSIEESVTVYGFLVSNTGRNPILPSDYIEPIQVSVKEPHELLAVEGVSYNIKDKNYDPTEVKVTWRKVATNTFEMKPTLLNPGDEFRALLFVSSPNETPSSQDIPDPIWTARIVNISLLKIQEPETASESSGLGNFYLSIRHAGWSVYWFAIFAISFFVIAILLGIHFKRLARSSKRQIITLAMIMAFSISSADIIVSQWINNIQQLWIASPVIGLHLLLLVYLVWPALRDQIALALNLGNPRRSNLIADTQSDEKLPEDSSHSLQ